MLTKQGKPPACERVSRTVITMDAKPAQANAAAGPLTQGWTLRR